MGSGTAATGFPVPGGTELVGGGAGAEAFELEPKLVSNLKVAGGAAGIGVPMGVTE